ncbi:restriction endonuclease subunit S [Prevotellamassilia timonensis]|uniref:restriction endonuclease subunit S n=1 Tax=Prevotellamassilia timonensis TaxID=1852370 RepID=UPI0030791998
MTTTKNNEHKKLNFSSEREQSQVCLNSAEHEKNQGRKVLNVPNLRFPEFQGEWITYKIRDVLSIGNGRDYKHLNNGEIPVFGTGGYMTSVDECLYDGETTFIGRKGSINKPFYYNGKFWTVDTLFYTHSFNGITPKFTYCLFQTINWLKYNEASGVPSLSRDTIEKIKINIPGFEEQNKIAKLMFALDERIATQNKIIEDLKKLKSAIIEKHYGQAEKLIVYVADLGESFSVGNLAKEDLTETGIPCVIYGELFTTYGETILQIESHTNKTESMVLSKKGDLLFPSSTTVDAMSLIAPSVINVDGVILGGDMFGIHINHNYNAQYLSYYFNHIAKRQLAKYAKGSTIIHLHYADIKKAKLSLPSLEEQNRMAKCLVILDDKIKVENSLLNLFNSQKAYLLCQMFI